MIFDFFGVPALFLGLHEFYGDFYIKCIIDNKIIYFVVKEDINVFSGNSGNEIIKDHFWHYRHVKNIKTKIFKAYLDKLKTKLTNDIQRLKNVKENLQLKIKIPN